MEDEIKSAAAKLRERAEKVLSGRTQIPVSSLNEADILKLLHELEVHSVEVDMQNEELQNAKKATEEVSKSTQLSENLRQLLIHEFEINQVALEIQNTELEFSKIISQDVAERYSDLFDISTSGYLILSNEGEIFDLNRSGANILGKDRFQLKNSLFGFFVSDQDKPVYNNFLKNIFSSKSKVSCDLNLALDNDNSVFVRATGIISQNGQQCLMTLLDITDLRQIDQFRDMKHEILQILNGTESFKESIHDTLTVLKKYTGFDAVGIRLKDNNDYPYLAQTGFSTEFLLTENTLLEYDKHGNVCLDKDGNPRMGCTCGLVISGKGNRSNPNFTVGGSWWTNDSFPVLKIPAKEDLRFRPRNVCMHIGYASVALVPIRNKTSIVGLIQFNDKRKDRFNLNTIEVLEGIASHIGAALMRKEAEEALHKNEELLRTITENAPDIIIELSREGIITYMNRAMPGYELAACIGKHFTGWTLAEYHELLNRSLRLVFEEQETQSYLSRGNDNKGETRWYRSSISPVKDGADVKNAILITRDITESISSEEILRETEEKLNAIILSAMDGFSITDGEGRFLEVNDTYCQMSGYTRHELLDMRIQDMEASELSEQTASHIQRITEQGNDRFESCHRRKDGSLFDVEVSVQYKPVDGGRFVSFIHDISKRKREEEKLHQSEQRYKSLFQDNYSVMLLIQPETGKILDANPTACKYYGFSKAKICAMKISDINMLSQPEVAAEMQKAKEEERNHFFFRHKLASGEIRDVEVYSGPIQFGEETMLYSLVHDITGRKQAEEALLQSEGRYKSMFQDNQSTLLIIDPDTGEIKDVNPAACEFYGWSYEEFCRKNISEINAVLSKKEISTNLRNSKEFKNNHLYFKHRLASGEMRDVEVYSGPIKFGESTLIYTIVHDITESKKNENALLESEKKLSDIYNSMSDGIAIIEIIYDGKKQAIDSVFNEVNPAFERIIGIKKDDLIGRKISEAIPIDLSILEQHYFNVESTGQTETFDVYIKELDKYLSLLIFRTQEGKFVTIIRDITEKKRAEEALRASERRLDAVFNSVTETIMMMDIEGKVLMGNRTAASRWGMTTEKLIGYNGFEYIHPDLKKKREMQIREMIDTRSAIRFEEQHQDITYDLIFYPIAEPSGEIKQFVVFNRDITEQKRAEEALKISERRLDAVFNSVKETIMLLDINGTVLTANQTAAERWGKSVDDIIGYNVFGYNDPTMKEKRNSQVREMLETCLPIQFEEPFQDKIFDLTFYPIIEPAGEINQFVIIHRDVTEVKRAEQALFESEEKFRTLIWDMQVGVLLQGPKAEILMSNPRALELLGLSEDQLLDKTSFDPDWNVIHEDGTPFPGETHPVPQAIATGKPVSDVVMGVYHPLIGERVWLLVHAVPELGDDGFIQQVVCTFIDITELKKAEKAVKESEVKFRNLVFDMEVGVLLNGPTSEILLANPKALDLLGLTEDQINGKTPFDPDWRPIHEDGSPFPGETHPAAVVIATRKAVKNVVMGIYQRLRGEHAWFLINAQPQLDDKGNLLQVVTTFVEITELREAQRELKESELRLKYHFENSPLGVVEWDNNFEVTQWSVEAEKIFGYVKEEVIGKPIADLNLIYEEDIPIVNNTMERLTSGLEDTVVSSNRNVTKTGSIITTIWYNSILFDEKGAMKSVMSLVEDITLQKQAEEALQESEILFRESQQAAFIGSYKTNFKTGMWESSEVMDQIFGIDNSFIKSVPGWLDIIHPDDRDLMNQYLYEEVVGKRLPFNKEYRIVRKNDGAVRWIHGMGRVGFDENNNLNSLVGTIQDIHERKLKEEALRKLNQTLAALSKSSQVMLQASDEADYLEKVCKIVVDDTDFTMAWIGYAEDDEDKTICPLASAGFNDDYLDSVKISWAENEFGRGPSGVAVRTGKMAMCNNMFTDPDFEPWREQALKRGYAASIVLPLLSGDKAFGVINIYAKEPDSFGEVEIKLLSELANDLSQGIITLRLREAKLRAEEELIKSYTNLEDQVKERTAELVKSNEIIKVAEEKYRTVADFAANWEFWIDSNDAMLYCSPSCERITGYKSTEFIENRKLMFDIIHPEDLQDFHEHQQTEMIAHICDHEIQYRIIRKDGTIRWIGHFCQPIFDEAGNFKGTRGSNKDITARKKMEALLITSNQKYKLLSENINDGIFICNRGSFEYINKAVYDIFGYEGKELEGIKLTKLIAADYSEKLEAILYTSDSSNHSLNVELECLRKDLTVISVEVLLNYVAKDKMVYGVIHDITEKKLIQKNILKAIIETEESEKAHFSKELHDGLGPLLSTIKLYLQWSERSKTDESRIEIIHKAEEILEDALSTVREVSGKLSPHLLTNYGLNSAIKSFVEKLSHSSEIKFIFESNFNQRLEPEIEASLYRAVIECINNSIKHSKAENIEIILDHSGSTLEIKYMDDGVGFDVKETFDKHKGLGLFNLQNRIENIGGKLNLSSQPGSGVNYQFVINIK